MGIRLEHRKQFPLLSFPCVYCYVMFHFPPKYSLCAPLLRRVHSLPQQSVQRILLPFLSSCCCFFRHQPKLLRRSEPPFLIPPGGGKIQRLQIDTTCVKPLFFYLYYRLTILALFSSSCYRGKGGSGFGGERSFFLLFVPPTDCRCVFFLGSFRLSGFL